MRDMMLFEWRKLWRSRKNQIILLLLLLVVIGTFVHAHVMEKDYMRTESKKCDYMMTYLKGRMKSNKGILSTAQGLATQQIMRLQAEIDYWSFEYTQYTVIGYFYKEGSEKAQSDILKTQNKLYEKRLLLLDEDPVLKDAIMLQMGKLSARDFEKAVMLNNDILKNKITPDINPYHLTGSKAWVMFFKSSNVMLLSLLATLIVVDGYLGELTEGSYKLTYTQPYTRRQVYWGKVIVLLGGVLCMFLLAMALAVILGVIFNGVGNWSYPISTRVSLFQFSMASLSAQAALLPLWQYCLLATLMLLSVVSLAAMVTLWISLVTDSNSIAMGATVLFLMMAVVFSLFSNRNSLLHLLYPYMYMGVERIMAVETRGNYMLGLSSNFMGIVVLQFLGLRYFVKKDLLGAKE